MAEIEICCRDKHDGSAEDVMLYGVTCPCDPVQCSACGVVYPLYPAEAPAPAQEEDR